jgi:hypothetical protein
MLYVAMRSVSVIFRECGVCYACCTVTQEKYRSAARRRAAVRTRDEP